MKMGRKFTGRLDKKGKKVFTGDKVMHCWGFFNLDGKMTSSYKIHTIKEVKEDFNVRFNMGNCWNSWGNGDVLKLGNKDLKKINIPEETDFFFNESGKAILRTGRYWFGQSEEKYQKMNKILTEELNSSMRRILFKSENDQKD